MKNGILSAVTIPLILLSYFLSAAAQQIEYKDGVKYIHNDKPKWGDKPGVKLKFVQTIGGIDEVDEDYIMSEIFDLDVDKNGDIFIIDFGSYRIQKYNSKGKYRNTIGRAGEGPGEFVMPSAISLDARGNIYVVDGIKVVIINKSGKEIRRFPIRIRLNDTIRYLDSGKIIIGNGWSAGGGKPNPEWIPVFSVLNPNGKILDQFGLPELVFLGVNSSGQDTYLVDGRAPFEIDGNGDIFAAYYIKNSIEKRDITGKVIYQVDRHLNYKIKNYKMENGRTKYPNFVSAGIGIDTRNRIWVLTVTEQPEVWDRLNPVRMDFAEFEIFDPEGILLGKVPLPEDTFRFRIIGDRLFIIGYDRVSVSEYRIVENSH
ncbi:6-bladed beta-propeller [candidate division KSB1 bacterium]